MEKTFHMLLYRAAHAERNYLRPCLAAIGLEVGQPKMLGYLCSHGSCQQNRLAQYFDIDSAAVSRMLDSLEKGGFITRRPGENNRRCNLVEITNKGEQAYWDWKEHCCKMEKIMLKGFSEQEKDQFSSYLSRLYHNLHTEKEGI